MVKKKVSATISPERIRRAQEVVGSDNLSQLLEQGLDALVERELERRWLDGHRDQAPVEDLPGEVPVDLSAVPWDAEG